MTPSNDPATSAVTIVECTSLPIVSGCTGLFGSLTNASIRSHRLVFGGTRAVTTSTRGAFASLAFPSPSVAGGRSRYANSRAGLTPERNSIVAASCSCGCAREVRGQVAMGRRVERLTDLGRSAPTTRAKRVVAPPFEGDDC